ncbi:hypothetical protein [Modestobacter sp. NPDC049651]|uniref:hypothetical protein n=1 Tax=unclassified Modestobacter TaxID=2643866 RepID=UPI0033C7B75C
MRIRPSRLLVLAGIALALTVAVLSALDGDVLGLVAGVLMALLIWWWSRPAAPSPAHVDDEWARGVLADAGRPTGVAAVKALRQAEPGLSLVDAKQLADRVAR